MKLNWSIFTPVTLTLLATATLSAEAQETRYDADIYLDALDADGHLSILAEETSRAKSNDEKLVSESKVSAAKKTLEATTEESKVSAAKKTLKATIEKPKAQVEKTKTEYTKEKDSDKVASAYKESYKSDSKAYAEVAAAPKAKEAKAEAYGGDYGDGASSSDQGFLSKHTTEIEFTFAILVIVVGLIASERFQRAHENHKHDFEESSNDFEQIKDV
ncbi:MAG: hypothetical protein AB4206_16380 [Xenococcaceae cyanobacterium]